MGQDEKASTISGCHAISLALCNSAGKVRKVTHTLPLKTRQAIRVLFGLVSRAVKRRGMLRDERERREWLHRQQHDSWKVSEMEGRKRPPL